MSGNFYSEPISVHISPVFQNTIWPIKMVNEKAMLERPSSAANAENYGDMLRRFFIFFHVWGFKRGSKCITP